MASPVQIETLAVAAPVEIETPPVTTPVQIDTLPPPPPSVPMQTNSIPIGANGDSSETKQRKVVRKSLKERSLTAGPKYVCKDFRDRFPHFDFEIAPGPPDSRANISWEPLTEIPKELCSYMEHVLVQMEVCEVH